MSRGGEAVSLVFGNERILTIGVSGILKRERSH